MSVLVLTISFARTITISGFAKLVLKAGVMVNRFIMPRWAEPRGIS